MKKLICIFAAMCFCFAFISCSNDTEFNDELTEISENNSPCYIDYFMNHYYSEFYYDNECILDKRDIKNFKIEKHDDQILLTIDYYERNSHGYISSILNTLDKQIRNEFKSDDFLTTPDASIQILCNHKQCLNKYHKYNTK